MHYTSIICRGHETKKQGCCVLARIPPALDAHLLGRSVRSVGKVAAVTQVTHNAQNNKGGEKRKNPENLESFSVSLSLSLSLFLSPSGRAWRNSVRKLSLVRRPSGQSLLKRLNQSMICSSLKFVYMRGLWRGDKCRSSTSKSIGERITYLLDAILHVVRPEVVSRVHELDLELIDRGLFGLLSDGHVVLLYLGHVNLELFYELLLVFVMRIPPASSPS